MIAGFALQDRPRRVIGIDGSAKPAETRAQVARIARHTAGLIGLERDLREDEIILDERYHAGTYAIPDDGTLEAIRLAGRLEGMITDPVYAGKSMAGLIDLIARGEIEPASNVLYAPLGGQPASRRPQPGRSRALRRRSPSSCRTWAGAAPPRHRSGTRTCARSTPTCRTSPRAGSAPAHPPRRRLPRTARA